jgi:hypothetical protein
VTPHDFPADVDTIARKIVFYLRSEGGCHTAPDLCAALHITGRELQHGVQWARMQGDRNLSLIGSGDHGYFWADDPATVRETVGQLFSRIRAIRKSADGMLRAAGEDVMQETMEL